MSDEKPIRARFRVGGGNGWIPLAFVVMAAGLSMSTAQAAYLGTIPPFPDMPPNTALQKRPIEAPDFPHPGLLSNSAVRPDQIHPLFPPDGVIFTLGSIVTIGWTPMDKVVLPDSARITPLWYEVEFAVDGHYEKKIIPYDRHRKMYHCLFHAVRPGRYQWQVAEIMPGGRRVKAPNRAFTVLPQNAVGQPGTSWVTEYGGAGDLTRE